MPNPQISRRHVLQAGGAAGLAAALGLAAQPAAAAAETTPRITDLGPAVVQFSLMSSVLIGDTVYIGSRNIDPVRIIALHLPTRRVVAQTDITNGHSIQALAADPTGRYLYAGVLQKADVGKPNLFRWDLTAPGTPAEPVGRIGDRDVRALSVAPDGFLYAVGGGADTAPALWELDPATLTVRNAGTPGPPGTLARAVAATATTVFFGAGTTFNGGGDSGRATLYAYDRSTGAFTSVAPAEMESDPSIRDLAVMGDKLVVGTAASTESAKVGVMDLEDLSSYAVATSSGTVVKSFTAIGDTVYYASESGILAYDTSSNSVSPVVFDGPDLGEIWGVDSRDGKVVVTSAFGFVAEIDPGAGTSTVTDLGEAGAPKAAQTAMGLAAGGGYVYVGGTGTIARHSLRSGAIVNLHAPGEAKDSVIYGGALYTGQYNAQGIWRYDPDGGDPISQVAAFPSGQNRPLDVTLDRKNGLVLAGVQCDTEGGGSLWTYDPRKRRSQCFVNPIDAMQCLRGIASQDGVAYLGGDNTLATGPRSTVVAFDPVRGKELWRIDPQQTAGCAALAVRGRHLYGLSRKGGLFVIDLRTRTLVHTADVRTVCNGFAAMVTNQGVVYGVSDTTVFRFDPRTFAVTTVVAAINGAWYSGSHLTNDEAGHLYTLRGRNLVRITDRPGR
ncbi:outer membrane protein assembly factor BamB family protein [Streptomyces sp. NBC_01465]|uniref:outer membrane protein assembly factor BamB family protein n=1 Tax=Streptomyces sp. NBC_01465 TaxID=2903878 RepID=UPI002E363A1E|nr:PQQ-binding-like beta-propeller repeat protein [Streptomyces sp. NBC_01465]